MELYGYYGKKVRATCNNGKIFDGLVDDYTSALDNEPDPESITIRSKYKDGTVLIELYAPEITKIEVIDEPKAAKEKK